MGLFDFFLKKKEWDEERSNKNKERMRLLFSRQVDDSKSYKVVYGFSMDATRGGIVRSKAVYTYTSLIIGYRESDMSIVILKTNPKLESTTEAEYFKRSDIEKAKITMGQYTIYHKGGMMAGYTSFSVIEDNDTTNDGDYLTYCNQEVEATEFEEFWKKYCNA
ncbi:hypothetical protein [Oceanivirga salmonicida]|uniref:hypothetical protein n=1 Tax=Oceanivirga salmonicida TaxID=1769291 RepID=UPI000829912C|nr:hypothetical protein [Oceanivirga salmonicida]